MDEESPWPAQALGQHDAEEYFYVSNKTYLPDFIILRIFALTSCGWISVSLSNVSKNQKLLQQTSLSKAWYSIGRTPNLMSQSAIKLKTGLKNIIYNIWYTPDREARDNIKGTLQLKVLLFFFNLT